jgi:DNA repair exonuclease SbcCD ATPase subunit
MKIEAILKTVGQKDAHGVCLAGVQMNSVKEQTIYLPFRGDIGGLAAAIQSAFGFPSVEIVYFDEDGDKIYLGRSQEELAEAIRCLGNEEPPTPKPEGEPKPEEEPKPKEEPVPEDKSKQQLQSEKRAKQRENLTKRKENLGQRIADIDKKIAQLQAKKQELQETRRDVDSKLEFLDFEDEIQHLPPVEQRDKRLQRFKMEKASLTQRLNAPTRANEKVLRNRLEFVSERINTIESNIAAQQERQKQNRIEGLRKQHANVTNRLEATPENKAGAQARLKERLDNIAVQLAELEREVVKEIPPPSLSPESPKDSMKQEHQFQKQAEKEERQLQKQAQRQQAQKAKQKAQLQAQKARLEAKVQTFQEKKNKNPKMIENQKMFEQRLRNVSARLKNLEEE